MNLLVPFVIVATVFSGVCVAQHQQQPEAKFYELSKGNFSVKLTNRGAAIVSVILPDKTGKVADVLLGFETVEEYANNAPSFGATVGRVANRIGGAEFTLNGTTYELIKNDGNNTLHGGHPGFGDVVWNVKEYEKDAHDPYITFAYHSFDGEQRFPGNLSVSITYNLLGYQMLSIVIKTEALNKATPVNVINHAYWNLQGHNTGDILSNTVQLFASHITPTNDDLIPTGEIVPVKDTPYDFLTAQTVGSRINELPSGYDINYVVNGPQDHKMKKIAVVHDPKSDRLMELWSDKPGVQFYTSNMLEDTKGKCGFVYGHHAALCLETQGFPDAVNHPSFPSVIVVPGKPYLHSILYQFSTMETARISMTASLGDKLATTV